MDRNFFFFTPINYFENSLEENGVDNNIQLLIEPFSSKEEAHRCFISFEGNRPFDYQSMIKKDGRFFCFSVSGPYFNQAVGNFEILVTGGKNMISCALLVDGDDMIFISMIRERFAYVKDLLLHKLLTYPTPSFSLLNIFNL